ncbi:M23 family metallopeptidase [Acaryochloris sp. 'Moss Beach']|uniref:peptidoglycan DD-metalloendopeptidase family protein n=1 Tax=Acaryochloris sp. 'Moss Beach' TaxID=2740837 RepID=UPI001F301C28
MKREIPQKIDITSSGVSTLLRRTRSASVLGLITVSAIGGLTTEQTAVAAVSSAHQKISTHTSVQLPDLIGSPRYKLSAYSNQNLSKSSRLFQQRTLQRSSSALIASEPNLGTRPTTLLTPKSVGSLALKSAPLESEGSSKSLVSKAGVSFTQSTLVGVSQELADELMAPLTSKNLLEVIDILDLDNIEESLELSASAILEVEPLLLAELPSQSLLDLDELLPSSDQSDVELSAASIANPLDLSSTLESNTQAIDSLDSSTLAKDSTEETTEAVDSTTALAVLPDIDLSQTIIPNEQNSALIDSGAIVHQVKPGETLDDISRLYQVSATEITKANRISDPASIGPKTKLRIPAHQSLSLSLTTVQDIVALNDSETENKPSDLLGEGEKATVATSKEPKATQDETPSLSTKASPPVAILPIQSTPSPKLKSDATQIATRNLLPQVPSLELPPLSSVDRYLPSQMLPGPQKYLWPAKGVLTSGFGWRWGRPHRGIDIAAPVGTPVIASAPGIVTTAGWNRWGYGNLVEIRHPDGSLTLYAHNHRIKTRVGQSVYQGQQIAEMGSTGLSTGPHTHFELHSAGKGAINPVPFLRKL